MLIAIFAIEMLFFCSTNAIFLVCRKKKIECAVQTFVASLPPFGKFCRLMVRVLPPYGSSLAALWRVFCSLMTPVLPPYDACFAAF